MVYRRGNTWWYEFVFDGERVRESTKQSNKRVAEQMEAAAKTQLAKGEVGIEERKKAPTFAEFAPRFMATIETQCADKPATVRFYRAKLKYLEAALADIRLDKIDEDAIEAYKNNRARTKSRRKRPLSPGAVNRELATLRRLIRMAHEFKLINRIPRVRMLRGEMEREYILTHELEPLYLAACPDPLDSIALLLLDCGLRNTEARLLDWTDVHLEPAAGAKYGYVTIRAFNSKNSKPRNVPLSERVVRMLKIRGPQKSGLVFTRESGHELTAAELDQKHDRVRKMLKLPTDFVLHSLRHTFGTRLGEAGADAFTIMKLMGHSTVTVSQRYVHPSPESVERAYERMQALNSAEAAKRFVVPTNSPTVDDRKKGKTEQVQ
jgi:integrase